MASPTELEKLLERLAAQDARSFAEFYDRTAGFVFGLLLRMLGDRSAAEDVAQEVYLQLWRSARTFDPGRSSALAWIALVTRSRAIDRLRADESLRSAVRSLRTEVTEVAPDPSPEEDATLAERRALVREALRTLPLEQRRVIELAFFEGLSHTQIAQRTDTPLGTVKTRIRSAIEKLEHALGALRG